MARLLFRNIYAETMRRARFSSRPPFPRKRESKTPALRNYNFFLRLIFGIPAFAGMTKFLYLPRKIFAPGFTAFNGNLSAAEKISADAEKAAGAGINSASRPPFPRRRESKMSVLLRNYNFRPQLTLWIPACAEKTARGRGGKLLIKRIHIPPAFCHSRKNPEWGAARFGVASV